MERKSNTRNWIGILFVLIGSIFLLDTLNIIPTHIIDDIMIWPTLLLVIGIILLINSKNKTTGIFFLFLWLISIVPEMWPIFIIGAGILILIKNHKKKPTSKEKENEENYFHNEYIEETAIFGGGKKNYQTNNFSGGKMLAIFGGSEIDLQDSDLTDGRNYLDILVLFGGITITVPADWKIEFDIVPILGGFSDERHLSRDQSQSDEKVLVIKGLVILGGGEIKSN